MSSPSRCEPHPLTPSARCGVGERSLEILLPGLTPYIEALEWQRALAADRIAGRLDHDVLLLLEHAPVITLGRGARARHLLDSDGLDVIEIERGGDITYHGPGQLIGYPILDLRDHRMDLHWYLRSLEAVLISALAVCGIDAERRDGYTGVWVDHGRRKIASIGVHVKQWVTWHGFALNVTTDLAAFDRMVPCGIAGVEMTSAESELRMGSATELWDAAVRAVSDSFCTVFGYTR